MVRVTLDAITKRFGHVVAVDGVTLKIEKGDLFFLLGPSGCGKTTLLRMVAGFYAPDEGTIRFDDRDMTNVPPHKRNTGMVFQNYALWPHMTVAENVAYGLEVRDMPASERQERVRTALTTVRMDSYADRTPNQLSGGQQQRIALARALVIEPDVVLLDEPLSNLDAKLRLEVRHEIRRIHDALGVTMMYVTHDQKEALSMADRVAVIDRGRIEQVGSPREVYSSPASTFVAGFIGETNVISGRIVARAMPVAVETSYGNLTATRLPETVTVDEVACSIRPEAMSVVVGNRVRSGGFIEGIVQSVVYLGDTEQYIVSLGGEKEVRCVESNPSQPKAQVGDRVRLTFEAEDVILLPSEPPR